MPAAECYICTADRQVCHPAGIYKVDQGQPVQDLCPDGSYVIPYEDIQKSTYNKQVLTLANNPMCINGVSLI